MDDNQQSTLQSPSIGRGGEGLLSLSHSPWRRAGWGFLLLFLLVITSCGKQKTEPQERFTTDVINKFTPVKDQGRSSLCWVYAMLATIESEHLMQGDSVNLSADYIARMTLREQAADRYVAQGHGRITTRGVAPHALELLAQYGVLPHDSYHAECNYTVLERRLKVLTDQAVRSGTGLKALLNRADIMLDETIRPLPMHVWMYRMEYTPLEMAHSVCHKDEYISLTSFTHKPFYQHVSLALPDNQTQCRFYNIPINSLVNIIVKALRTGHCVCWEGDTSEQGFSFKKGVARLGKRDKGDKAAPSQGQRQREFESFRTTDDHCMELIGLAHDGKGRHYFICKNSWGTANPYGGLMYMSEDYLQMKTIAVVVSREVMKK